MSKLKLSLLLVLPLTACSSDPNEIQVTLAPEVISSLDGTLTLQAEVFHDNNLEDSKAVTITVDYTDRNGMAHMIAGATGQSDSRGIYQTTLTGLTWDGTGTVHATSGKAEGAATFSVLDRSPPKVTITPPTLHANQDATIMVHVTDEIGISSVQFETSNFNGNGGNGGRQRTTIVTSGSTDAMVPFDLPLGQVTTGTMITLYSVATDLSGNEGVATPVTATVQ